MAQFNITGNTLLATNKSIADVVLIANSSGGIINSFGGSGGVSNVTISTGNNTIGFAKILDSAGANVLSSNNALNVNVLTGGITSSTTAALITPGTPVTAGNKALIVCTVVGNITLKLSSSNTFTIPVNVGVSELVGYAIVDVVAGSTTATATVTIFN